jgi:predicted MFS family arabinose efflux permease
LINYNLLIRLSLVGAIGVVSFLILIKLITWPEKSKAKRTGQIVNDYKKLNKKALCIYIIIWILLVFAGVAIITFM